MAKADKQLSNSITEEFKSARIALGLSQDDVAEKAGLSRGQYQRIESGGKASISTSLYKKICSVLNIKGSDRVTITLSEETRKNLEEIRVAKDFNYLSEAIVYCIEQVCGGYMIERASVEIKNDIRESLANTFVAEMNKLHRSLEIDDVILRFLDIQYGIGTDKIKAEVNDYITRLNHSKKY